MYPLVSEAIPALPGIWLRRDPTPTLPARPILPRAQTGARLAQQKGSPKCKLSSWTGLGEHMCRLCVCTRVHSVITSH